MSQLYRKLRKKAIILVLAVLAVFFNIGPAFALVPNDQYYSYQQKMWEQIGAPAAWDISTGSDQVTVAVIDTGADRDNPDIASNIVGGWNFIDDNNDVETPAATAGDDPGAVHHGTVAAGLIGAVGNNGVSGAGLNWKVKIMPLRAIKNTGSGSLANVAKAIDYAVDHGADVISISLVGDTGDPDIVQSLARAYDAGAVVVAAGGNRRVEGQGNLDDNPLYPICADKGAAKNFVLGVTSVDNNDVLSDFSDYGSCVDITAPGEGIFSTEKYEPSVGLLDAFGGAWSGTSFSVPLVAGAAALVKAVRPDLHAKEIIDVLLRSADDVDSVNPGFAGRMGYGRLNVAKALRLAQASSAPTAPTFEIFELKKHGNFYSTQVGDNVIREWADRVGLHLKIVNSTGDISLARTIKGLGQILDTAYGKFGDVEKIFALSARGKQLSVYVIDVASDSYLRSDLDEKFKKGNWKILAVPGVKAVRISNLSVRSGSGTIMSIK